MTAGHFPTVHLHIKTCQCTIERTLDEKVLTNMDTRDDKMIEKLVERIFFRCAIAHAKGDIDEYLVPS